MESTSTQGFAVMVFLLAFTFLGLAFFSSAKLIFILLFLVCLAGSVILFQKLKPGAQDDLEAPSQLASKEIA
jgi:hypothetical protein